MKVLKFLIASNYNRFTKMLIGYLIDSGHIVDIIDDSNNPEWLKLSNYNLKNLNIKDVNLNLYDLTLNFSNILKIDNAREMVFDFNLSDDAIAIIKIGICQKHKYLELVDSKFIFHYQNSLDQELYELFSNITELFIDAVIIFLRMEENALNNYQDLPFQSNDFSEMLKLDEQLHSLSIYYQSVNDNPNKFNLTPDFSIEKHNIKQFESHKYSFTLEHLEIFTIYLLTLFNARSAALYSYDLIIGAKHISKYIDLDPFACNYKQLLALIKNNEYRIIDNKFYSNHGFFDYKSDTLVLYGSEQTITKDYLLKILYNPELNNLSIQYNASLYFFDQLFDLTEHFFNLLLDKQRKANSNLYDMLYHNPKVYFEQLYSWNEKSRPILKNKTVNQLFEKQVKATPNAIALVYENKQFSYNELNEKANQLANYLITTYKVNSEDLICLCLDRSEHMLIAILAVLKSGGAYVPIDPNYPDDRIKYIFADIKAKVLLSNNQYASRLRNISQDSYPTPIELIDNANFEAQLIKQKKATPKLSITNSNLAYVIYTSGTTGKPKGVMVEHKALVAFAMNNSYVSLKPNERVMGYSEYVFDGSIFDIFVTLLNGGQLYLLNKDQVLNVDKFHEIVTKSDIDYIFTTTALLQHYMLLDNNPFKFIKNIFFGGEKANAKLLSEFIDKNPKINIVHVYGPTENITFSTFCPINQQNMKLLPIGKHLNDKTTYILDSHLNPLPIGAIGELYLGGAAISRGYLNFPVLTNERFIPNPFQSDQDVSSEENTKIYKTGDLVRYLPDGNIDYIGRNDFQVKIRGYRLELGEIENQLTSYPGIKQVIVLAQEKNSNKYLVGYYVSVSRLAENDILNHLSKNLPEYMIPNALVWLKELPLNINGKVDRRALPQFKLNDSMNYVAPRSEEEKLICAIWASALCIPETQLSVFDNFFKLGGNSILAIKLIYQINKELNKNIEIKALYDAPNVALFAQQLNSEEFKYKNFQITKGNQDKLYEPFDLSSVQLSYAIGRTENNILGNVATHLYYEVVYNEVDKTRLENSINRIINRHIVLKSKFTEDLKQKFIDKDLYYSVPEIICHNKMDLENIRSRMSQEIIQFDQIPFFNIVLSRLSFDSISIVHFSFDALLLDVSSLIIFIRELEQFYNTPGLILPQLNINFKDYQEQIFKIKQTELYEIDKQYWLNKIGQYNLEFRLPLSNSFTEKFVPKFSRIVRVIDKTLWQQIVIKAQNYGISLTAVVLMAYGKTMAHWSGQKNICINNTLFNRLPLHEQINEVMGDFTVLSLFNYADQSVSSVIQHIQSIHDELWADITHSLFDGVEVTRLIRKVNDLGMEHAIAPIVLTSVLGNELNWVPKLGDQHATITYMTAQTPQVWIDNKAYEVSEGFVAEWDYVEQLFDRETIQSMHADYCKLIEKLAVIDWEKESIPDLTLPEEDYQLILNANSSKQDMPVSSIHELYYNNIATNNYDDLIAVIDDETEKKYSHREIEERSKNLSKYLVYLSKTKPQNQLIAILSEKGINQVIACLGIMGAGYGYLPLNVEWPSDRILDILLEGDVVTVIISQNQFDKLKLSNALVGKYNLVVIEGLNKQISSDKKLSQTLQTIILPKVNVNDIAYVIFTSGSTGKPKGVTINHLGALNTINSVNKEFNITSNDCVFALSELSFDLSVYDIFGLLIVGGSIVFPKQTKVKDPSYWLELIDLYNITIWNSVPQFADLLINELEIEEILINKLRLFLLSGDWIPVSLPAKIRQKLNNINSEIISLGGATEGSIWSIWYKIGEVSNDMASIPYGIAMPNQKIYVLDHKLNMCHVGSIGEIYIGGCGVALNYWKNEEFTASSFINHSHLGRIYRTGDLGRWTRGGYVEYLGRNDFQVKIRGFRVELGEIENAITNYPGIKQAIVLAKTYKIDGNDSHNKYLVGYYVSESPLNEAKILDYLTDHLPEYMVPQILIHLESISLTINGKIDRSALPEPNFMEADIYVAPRNELERIGCESYAQVLGLDVSKIGIDDDFFKLGGNSISAIKLVSKIYKQTNIKIKIADIFAQKSIRNLLKEKLPDDTAKGTHYEF